MINCKCGMSYTYYNRSRHFKTKQHLETMRELEELDDDTSLDAQEGQHIGTIQGIRYRAKGLIGELECDDLSEEQIKEINDQIGLLRISMREAKMAYQKICNENNRIVRNI